MKFGASHATVFWSLSLVPFFLGATPGTIVAEPHSRPVQDTKDDGLIICPAHVVRVEVVVRDEVGKDVADLRMKDFKIYEGEANQVICFWERQETSAKGQTSTHYKFGYYPMNKNIDDNRRRIKVQVTAEGKAVDLQLDGPVS